jgi:tRNA (adenine22-N1)-methyltransferase
MNDLAPRLQTIFDALLCQEEVWDVCCDHGYVGLRALKENTFPFVHFVDQVPHIIETLPQDSPRAHYHPVPAEELDQVLGGSVVIAGVGAFTILSIVQSWEKRGILKAKRLILAPQKDPDLIAMQERPGYKLIRIELVEERGRDRFIMIYDQL